MVVVAAVSRDELIGSLPFGWFLGVGMDSVFADMGVPSVYGVAGVIEGSFSRWKVEAR